MTRDECVEIIKQRETCMECVVTPSDCGKCENAFNIAIQSIEMLNKIENLINDPLVKACGSIGTQKIKEVLDG